MIISTKANKRPVELKVFRNYEIEQDQSVYKDPLVWEIAKVTSAAPSYFRLEHPEYTDGDVVANNSTEEVLVELNKLSDVN